MGNQFPVEGHLELHIRVESDPGSDRPSCVDEQHRTSREKASRELSA
jgi:hypothetical protein